MGPLAATRSCLGKFLHLAGRASRPEYWWFWLFVVLVTLTAQLIDTAIFGPGAVTTAGHRPFTLLATFLLFFPTLSAGWRRMHDTGHPGWLVLAPQLIVMAGLGAFMVGVMTYGVIEGATGDTRLTGLAAAIGQTGLSLVWIAVLAALAVKLWFLTRPGDPGPNAYGPPPPA